jgi:hypothetical protein
MIFWLISTGKTQYNLDFCPVVLCVLSLFAFHESCALGWQGLVLVNVVLESIENFTGYSQKLNIHNFNGLIAWKVNGEKL